MAYNNPIRGQSRYNKNVYLQQTTAGYNITYREHSSLSCSLTVLVSCEVTARQRQASDKRSFHKVTPLTRIPLRLPISNIICKDNTLFLIVL